MTIGATIPYGQVDVQEKREKEEQQGTQSQSTFWGF
jgi:hypothetical protein